MMMILLVLVALSYFIFSSKQKNWPSWPVVGMLPSLVLNLHHMHAAFVDLLEANGGAVLLRFGWSEDLKLVMTTHPNDIRHIMKTNADFYIKGEEWWKRFDLFGNSYFNSDTQDVRSEKVEVRSFLAHHQVHRLMAETFDHSLKELMTTLSSSSQNGSSIDLSVVLQRQMYSTFCRTFVGCKLPHRSHEQLFVTAIDDAFEAILVRFVFPCWMWRMMRWVNIGQERKMRRANKTLKDITMEQVLQKRRQLRDEAPNDDDFSFLNLYIRHDKFFKSFPDEDNALRENLITLLFAAVDTTTTTLNWFFWVLSHHPNVEEKIIQELKSQWPENELVLRFGAKELEGMVYLHAALCETLRLFPPVAFEARTTVHPDTLPSGCTVTKRTKVILAVHAMGRMKHIWGEDCHEFMPERWITPEGRVKYEPPHKFFAFNAGQRMCPGKDIALDMMKATIGNILYKYRPTLEKNYPATLKASILLQMKDHLMAKIEKIS